jgi:hypothetical protein
MYMVLPVISSHSYTEGGNLSTYLTILTVVERKARVEFSFRDAYLQVESDNLFRWVVPFISFPVKHVL